MQLNNNRSKRETRELRRQIFIGNTISGQRGGERKQKELNVECVEFEQKQFYRVD